MTKALDTALEAVSKIGKPEVVKSHTPTPWVRRSNRFGIKTTNTQYGCFSDLGNCDVIGITFDKQQANAAFIVRAANAHDALVEGLQKILETANAEEAGALHSADWCPALVAEMAREALKLARGEG